MINQTALNWLGRNREDVVGRLSFRDLVDPSQLAKQNERRQQLESTGHLEPEEVALRLPDGRAFVGLASSTVVRDEQGQFVRTNSTLIDITERKRADAALQAQRDFLQNITNSIPVQLAFSTAT
ncbi:PAS domain S-box protein [Hydrogenophaga sp. T4]|nr:PAS domain S-box protein [Hydrogenophaga sp. T4]